MCACVMTWGGEGGVWVEIAHPCVCVCVCKRVRQTEFRCSRALCASIMRSVCVCEHIRERVTVCTHAYASLRVLICACA